MTKIWQKPGLAKLHPLVEEFTVGDDLANDLTLFPYDIRASKAHATMLQHIGILTPSELDILLLGLDELQQLHQQGEIRICHEDEDGHTVIENYLIEKYGDAGKKIHTGRSRNDQSLVALRLFLKENAGNTRQKLLELARIFLEKARQYEFAPLPGYSHMQQAMLSTVGHWYCSFAESLLDDAELLQSIEMHINKNPLGSAAGFGVSIPLDRQSTTDELGFAAIQQNSLYCQASRGKFESLYMEGLVQVMLSLGRFAQDMLFFTAQETAYFAVDSALVTGSSIMPQKRNLDGLEILRGHVSSILSSQHFIQDTAKNLLSGYNREFQLLKKPLIESTSIVQQSIDIAALYLEGSEPQPDVIQKHISTGIFAADIANDLVSEQKMPFREAYKKALEQVEQEVDLLTNIKKKVSLGAPGNLGIKEYEKRLQRLQG